MSLRVLNLAQIDTGGNAHRTKDAFARHAPDWTYDFVTAAPKYMLYPTGQSWAAARSLWELADVVHLRNEFGLQQRLRAPSRPLVIQHHGSLFRLLHERLVDEARRRRAISLVSTLDLWLLEPEHTEWLPTPYDLDWLERFRRPRNNGVLRIAHAPTDRVVKSTEAFLRAVERLSQEVPVELVLIERTSWAECLRRKGTADIYFDQTMLGYGNNAVEAWGMGIPVVCGAADRTLEEMRQRFGSLPFYLADEGSIYEALAELAEPDTRAEWGWRGLDHVRQWHDEAFVVRQLVDAYTRAAGT